jgi:uroporphyrinogen-III decarboxylase
LLRELAEECQQRILALLDVLLEKKNIDVVWMGGCEWITPPMASLATYRELVQELELPIIERIHYGSALSHIHCHGNIDSTLELIIERGADFTEPVEPPPDGNISFADAKRRGAGRITLGGNIEARILAKGSAEETERAVKEAFEGEKERMVLMPSAYPIDPFTPQMRDNYHRLIDMWETTGETEQ